ncbi:hypothetical protein BS47DRAFT_1345204 [Hydnum rufescens UP504]|uniref:Uncharacterized protein n=1 Tax=Hydnum rufescens UP504 TaxID=1448309 RepID=A0A9P6DSX1_9AGAM|nr:hypothetical protein BS47DRAFT_1345204 [Hydnum rufescens UP504]
MTSAIEVPRYRWPPGRDGRVAKRLRLSTVVLVGTHTPVQVFVCKSVEHAPRDGTIKRCTNLVAGECDCHTVITRARFASLVIKKKQCELYPWGSGAGHAAGEMMASTGRPAFHDQFSCGLRQLFCEEETIHHVVGTHRRYCGLPRQSCSESTPPLALEISRL